MEARDVLQALEAIDKQNPPHHYERVGGLAVLHSLLLHKSRDGWPCPASRPATTDRGDLEQLLAAELML